MNYPCVNHPLSQLLSETSPTPPAASQPFSHTLSTLGGLPLVAVLLVHLWLWDADFGTHFREAIHSLMGD
jgi:hypothetical protein